MNILLKIDNLPLSSPPWKETFKPKESLRKTQFNLFIRSKNP